MHEIHLSEGLYISALEYNALAWMDTKQDSDGFTLAAFYAWIDNKLR